MTWLTTVWRWLVRSVRPLPAEPTLTQPKQVDPSSGNIGIRIPF